MMNRRNLILGAAAVATLPAMPASAIAQIAVGEYDWASDPVASEMLKRANTAAIRAVRKYLGANRPISTETVSALIEVVDRAVAEEFGLAYPVDVDEDTDWSIEVIEHDNPPEDLARGILNLRLEFPA